MTSTINLKTRRGWLVGPIVLASSSGVPVYKGSLVLITQGLPSNGTKVPARGWISAATYTGGSADGGRLLANVEFRITGGTFAASGQFGDAAGSLGTPNYAVTEIPNAC